MGGGVVRESWVWFSVKGQGVRFTVGLGLGSKVTGLGLGPGLGLV